jgi:hypothetical protein
MLLALVFFASAGIAIQRTDGDAPSETGFTPAQDQFLTWIAAEKPIGQGFRVALVSHTRWIDLLEKEGLSPRVRSRARAIRTNLGDLQAEAQALSHAESHARRFIA